MRRAGGVWEPGPRRWLIRRHRMGPLIRNLRRATHRPGRASVSDAVPQRQRTLRATAQPGRCAAALPTDEQRRQAEWARLNAQIERWRKQARWEPWKALAAIVGAAALMIAAALALSHWHVP